MFVCIARVVAGQQAQMLGAYGDAGELDLRQRRAEGAAGDAPKRDRRRRRK